MTQLIQFNIKKQPDLKKWTEDLYIHFPKED